MALKCRNIASHILELQSRWKYLGVPYFTVIAHVVSREGKPTPSSYRTRTQD